MLWLMVRKSKLFLDNILLLYKCMDFSKLTLHNDTKVSLVTEEIGRLLILYSQRVYSSLHVEEINTLFNTTRLMMH